MWIRLALLLCLIASIASAASVQWDASVVDAEHGAPDGYRVYYGYTADQLTTTYDVGTELNFTIPETWNPATYYFGVRAYNASGESGWATTPEGQTWVSYVKAEPPPVLPPAPATDVQIVWEPIEEPPVMAISRLGYEIFTDGSDPSANSITVPADTKAIAVLAAYYDTSGGLTSVNIDGSINFTVDGSLYGSAGNDHVAIAHYLGAVTSGGHTLNIDWSGARDYMGAIYVVYLGATGTVELADVDYAAAFSRTVTVAIGDYILCVAGVDATISWTNATELNETSGSLYSSLAYLVADGTSETISVTDTNTAMGVIAFHEATGGASAVPAMMRSYRARRN